MFLSADRKVFFFCAGPCLGCATYVWLLSFVVLDFCLFPGITFIGDLEILFYIFGHLISLSCRLTNKVLTRLGITGLIEKRVEGGSGYSYFNFAAFEILVQVSKTMCCSTNWLRE